MVVPSQPSAFPRNPAPVGIAVGAVLSALVVACSGDSQGAEAAGERSIQGFVTVERSVASGQEAGAATSVVRFVDAPDSAGTRALLDFAGLTQSLPDAGQCWLPNAASALSFSDVGTVQLLDAGEVAVRANGEVRRLAPHTFPDVAGVASGVMYTSRESAPELLPADVDYTITTSGSQWVPGLSLSAQAPKELENVTIGGVPIGELTKLPINRPMDLTWGVGEPQDVVYVELSAEDDVLVCAFRDDAGAATIGEQDLSTLGVPHNLVVAVHRTRAQAYLGSAEARFRGAELRFDFELTRSLVVSN